MRIDLVKAITWLRIPRQNVVQFCCATFRCSELRTCQIPPPPPPPVHGKRGEGWQMKSATSLTWVHLPNSRSTGEKYITAVAWRPQTDLLASLLVGGRSRSLGSPEKDHWVPSLLHCTAQEMWPRPWVLPSSVSHVASHGATEKRKHLPRRSRNWRSCTSDENMNFDG